MAVSEGKLGIGMSVYSKIGDDYFLATKKRRRKMSLSPLDANIFETGLTGKLLNIFDHGQDSKDYLK